MDPQVSRCGARARTLQPWHNRYRNFVTWFYKGSRGFSVGKDYQVLRSILVLARTNATQRTHEARAATQLDRGFDSTVCRRRLPLHQLRLAVLDEKGTRRGGEPG